MTYLYNCKHDGDQYRVTKFDANLNVESSYLCTTTECECPAGVRQMCRHREMLPRFIQRRTVGTDWFYDYDRGGWVQNEIPTPGHTDLMVTPESIDEFIEANPLPEGVSVLSLDDPATVHNAIAEAIGEPEATWQVEPTARSSDVPILTPRKRRRW